MLAEETDKKITVQYSEGWDKEVQNAMVGTKPKTNYIMETLFN